MDNFELWYRYHKDKGDMPAGVSKYLNYKYGLKKHAGTISAKWAGIRNIVRAGRSAEFFTVHETQLSAKKSGTELTFDVLGLDHDTPSDPRFTHSMTLQTHDCVTNLLFDAVEAFYYCENGLAAGTYYFTIDSTYEPENNDYSSYQFTLAQNVPAGGQLTFPWSSGKASRVRVSSFASATSTTAIEQRAVIEGAEGQNLGHLTAAGDIAHNLNSIIRVRFGSNNYKESAIRQWLNSSAAAGSVWTPQTKFDRPPSWAETTAGFMHGMDADFLAAVGKTHIITARNTVCDGGGYDEMDDYFFLLSRSQLYAGDELAAVNEGEPYEFYSDYSELTTPGTSADNNRIRSSGGVAQVQWTRSPHSGTGDVVRSLLATGALSNRTVSGAYYFSPACNII